jgi:hypothetical protein
MMQFLAADRAAIDDLEEFAEHLSLAAVRAAAQKAPPN